MTSTSNTVRLTGAWKREGKFGAFSVGTIKLAELNEALAKLGNLDVFEIVISPVQEKKSDSSPDFNINFRPKLERTDSGAKPATGGYSKGRSADNKQRVANIRRF